MRDRVKQLQIALMVQDTTQAELAHIAGVSEALISRVIHGTAKPSKRIVEAFRAAGIEIEAENE